MINFFYNMNFPGKIKGTNSWNSDEIIAVIGEKGYKGTMEYSS